MSNSLKQVTYDLHHKVTLLNGEICDILAEIHSKNLFKLYIDGGTTIQSFLKEDLIDELRITTIPVLLGGGFPLFGNLSNPLLFDLFESKVFLKHICQNHYKRRK